MIEPGRGLAYVVLFSELGLTLLVTTLFGALGGHWVDEQLGTSPLLVVIGFLAGAGAGAWVNYRLVKRFLSSIE